MDFVKNTERKPDPMKTSSFISRLLFLFTIRTALDHVKRPLTEKDLFKISPKTAAAKLGFELEKAWNAELKAATKANRTPSLKRTIFKILGVEIMVLGVLLVITDALWILQPVLFERYLKYFSSEQGTISRTEACLYAGGITLIFIANMILYQHFISMGSMMGVGIRVACCSLIYRKALKLSEPSLKQTSLGQIINLLSNDVNKFDRYFLYLLHVYSIPIPCMICGYLLFNTIGETVIIGLIFIFVLLAIQVILVSAMMNYRRNAAGSSDERILLTKEIISGIQVVKMYAWEKAFAQIIEKIRRLEMKTVQTVSLINGFMESFFMFTTRTAIFITILVLVYWNYSITAEYFFIIYYYLNLLRIPTTKIFTLGIVVVEEANISFRRLSEFLSLEEKSKMAINDVSYKKLSEYNERFNSNDEKLIWMHNISAKWSKSSNQTSVKNINLRITAGMLLAITGPTGSGKSSLLHIILREIPIKCGNMEIKGDLSYASQEPWLFEGTVKQNILFGQPLNDERYRHVIRVCALDRDLKLLPCGDETLIGDRGATLSGGQRARINMSRALYRQANIYLLDDPLSSVDANVGRQIFWQAIKGFLKGKTVLFTSHQMQYLTEVDRIIYLENGLIKAEGSYEEVIISGNEFFSSLNRSTYNHAEINQDTESSTGPSSSEIQNSSSKETEEPTSKRKPKCSSCGSYLAIYGICYSILVAFLFLITQIIASFSDYTLSNWSVMKQKIESSIANNSVDTSSPYKYSVNDTDIFKISIAPPEKSTETLENMIKDYYAKISYISCAILVMIAILRSSIFYIVSVRTSIRLHKKMFNSIISAPMNFFHRYNAGRLLNRFSNDMGNVDSVLPSYMHQLIQISGVSLGCFVTVGIINPWFLIPAVILGLTCYFLRQVYGEIFRHIKHLECICHSPIFSHVSTTMLGLTTVRTFKAEKKLIEEFDQLQDLHSSGWYTLNFMSRSFQMFLDVLPVTYTGIITFSFLFSENVPLVGVVGLAVTQGMSLFRTFQWAIRTSTDFEIHMASLERILDYSNVKPESKRKLKPPQNWPNLGRLEFKNLFLSYISDSQPVLHNINFVINPMDRIGIVGRTGAGKSSLVNAIFQLTNVKGSIFIDGVDITQVSLESLRTNISVIPQQPFLFSNTVRINLDPQNRYNDADLWSALENVDLARFVACLKGNLDFVISEDGSNLSVGQKQLICLARAILSNNKILILDEATANVDPRTDLLIQKTIRTKFSHCTILTIAHRLNTIMDSDKVLVMEAGTVQEFDHPYKLLQNKTGVFHEMVWKTGSSTAEELYRLAEENYLRNRV